MRYVLIICALLLTPTSVQAAPGLKQAMTAVGNGNPRPSSFTVCHGRDCRVRTRVKLSRSEWSRVRAMFPARSAAQERKQIARAIGYLERVTGKKAGTSSDRAGTFSGNAFADGQMDCEDETQNTAAYLVMMEDAKLLRFHQVIGRAHRGYFLNRWPHRAVQIGDKKTREVFAVDSWFHDNGKPAEIVPLAQWKNGWSPKSN